MQVREHYYKGGELYIKCCSCGEIKKSDLFYSNKRNKFGIDNRCKTCEAARAKEKLKNDIYRQKRNKHRQEYRESHREKENLYSKKYRQTHKKQCRDYAREYARTHPEILKEIYIRRKDKIEENNLQRRENKRNEFGIDIKKFHAKAGSYSKRHNLKPNICSICGDNYSIELHHPSYEGFEKRKEVVFLCRSCHKRVHTGELECPEPIDLVQLNAHMPKILTDKDLELCKR